jgi:glycosyltransferase involved in cell wall biosynthesis
VVSRLDLLYVGTLPPHPGGSAISMSEILRGLAGRGHRVRAVGAFTDEDLLGSDLFADRNPELEIHRFVMPFLDTAPDVPKPGYDELEQRQIVEIANRLIGERRPDLAVAGRESFVRYVPEIADAYGIPVVAWARGSTTHAMANGTYPRELTEAVIAQFRRTELVVTPARHLADSLGRLGVPGVKVMRNPVDLERFGPAGRDETLARVLRVAPDSIVVAHFSNMTPDKRPLDIVAAAAIARPLDRRLRFLIVGNGPLREEMEDACSRAGLESSFRFVDWVDYEEIPSYLGVADIVVQPSRAEGQARIYLETQATGRALIASDIPAAREVVLDGENGLLYPVGEVQELAARVLHAAASPELRVALGKAARGRAQAHALPDVVEEHEQQLIELAAVTPRGVT